MTSTQTTPPETLVEIHVSPGKMSLEDTPVDAEPEVSGAVLRSLDRGAALFASMLSTVVVARGSAAEVDLAAAVGGQLARQLSGVDTDLEGVTTLSEYLDSVLVKLPGRAGRRVAALAGMSATEALDALAHADVLGIPWRAAAPLLRAIADCRSTHPGASVAAACLISAEQSLPTTTRRSAVYRTAGTACGRWAELAAIGYPDGWVASSVRSLTGLVIPG